MEANGSPLASFAQKATAIVPDAVMAKVMQVAGIDRMAALNTAIEAVSRGGTVSLSGVYGGATDPMPLMRMFDKQVHRVGGAAVDAGQRARAAAADHLDRGVQRGQPVDPGDLHDLLHDRVGEDRARLLRDRRGGGAVRLHADRVDHGVRAAPVGELAHRVAHAVDLGEVDGLPAAAVDPAELYEQIGRLKVELEFVKKKAAQFGG